MEKLYTCHAQIPFKQRFGRRERHCLQTSTSFRLSLRVCSKENWSTISFRLSFLLSLSLFPCDPPPPPPNSNVFFLVLWLLCVVFVLLVVGPCQSHARHHSPPSQTWAAAHQATPRPRYTMRTGCCARRVPWEWWTRSVSCAHFATIRPGGGGDRSWKRGCSN